MTGRFHREQLYRGAEAMARIARARIVVCGAGAVGSNLVNSLVRQGAARLRVIDRDRVEQHNLSTQLWTLDDVGAYKAEALQHLLFRAAGVEIEAVARELGEKNIHKLLAGADLVVDGFDNSASRRIVSEHCAAENLPCLHVGLSADYAEVIWNERYRVPSDVAGDLCNYPLARNVVLLATAVAGECVLRYLAGGARESWTVTLGDFSVRPFQ